MAQQSRDALRCDALRYRGLYPPECEESNEWVKRLKDAGELLFAIEIYRRLHRQTPLLEARILVEAL